MTSDMKFSGAATDTLRYNMPEHLILIRQPSHLRNISEAEVLNALPRVLRDLPRTPFLVDMREFEHDVEGQYWDRSHGYIVDQAQKILATANSLSDPVIAFFGLAEVPHIITLGAFLGDERRILIHDLYGTNDWSWPTDELTIKLRAPIGLPTDRESVTGEVALRLEVTYPIEDEDVNAVITNNRFNDVTIGVENPRRGTIQSIADLDAIRESCRTTLGILRERRPGLQKIHLFCAAPASVCFAIGQELQLRNSVPVVTYRYRANENSPPLREAIVLSSNEAFAAARPLNDEEISQAAFVRAEVWPAVLDSVVRYAISMAGDNPESRSRLWYAPLRIAPDAAEAQPFRSLPPLWKVLNPDSSVNPQPLPGFEPPYFFPETTWAWQLTDRLLVAQHRAARMPSNDTEQENVDQNLLNRLIRLFLFHETVHKHHGLTKYTAEGVGRFPNVLERLDYMADVYAALHELDYTSRHLETLRSEDEIHDELVKIVDDILRSHWAFIDVDEAIPRWQVRHLRRFLNWYWRWVQINRARMVGAGSLNMALRLLAWPPAIEIAGLEQHVSGRRVFARIDRLDNTTQFSLAVVLENDNFLDIADQANVNLRELMKAFMQRDHEGIKSFFQTVYEKAAQANGALPISNKA